MASAFDERLRALRDEGRKLLVCYLPLGDPALGDRVDRAGELLRCGADVLELGMPCREPALDGRVVAESMGRALGEGSGGDPYEDIERIRSAYPHSALQVMTYWELVVETGVETFAERVAASGVDAVLCPNAPEDERGQLAACLRRKGLALLDFVRLDSSADELARISKRAEGYAFMQAVHGKTGVAAHGESDRVGANIARMRSFGSSIPHCAGFGISRPEDVARYISAGADGVIIGSALLLAMLDGNVEQFLTPIREELDRGRIAK